MPAALCDGLVEGLFAAMQAGEGDAGPLSLQRGERYLELLKVSLAERGDGRPLGLRRQQLPGGWQIEESAEVFGQDAGRVVDSDNQKRG